MALLELVGPRPDWMAALEIALTRPAGVPERRSGEDPFDPSPPDPQRPRRISDDLAWLRQAVDEPARFGLETVEDGSAAVAVWRAEQDEPVTRLCRLRDRGILDAGGFLLHESGGASEI